MQATLDRWHAAARRRAALGRLAIVSRLLLAAAFLPTGMVKLLGERFTAIPPEHPVGAFFEALYQSGSYWNFIGLAQVVAALLLLLPATATLGALLFLPIVINVTVITWSIGFGGTRWITLLMTLACLFLLCWDYHRWRAVLFAPDDDPGARRASLPVVERSGYVVGGLAGIGVLTVARGLLPSGAMLPLLVLGGVGALLVLSGWVQATLTERRLRDAAPAKRG